MDDELLKLDNQICFKLYAASRAVTKLYRPLLDKLNLTYPQYLVMLVLWQHDKEKTEASDDLTVREIGQRLQLDSGTLTPLLKRMEQDALITRNKTAHDGRELHISLTTQGRELREEAVQVPTQLLCNEKLPIGDIPQIQQTLNGLLEALASLE